MSEADRLCLRSLLYNEHLPALTCLPSNPFVVCLPFSLFCLPLCSCHSSVVLHLSFSLVQHLSLSSPGLTVLPLLNERFANRTLTVFVLCLFTICCSQCCLFYQQLNCITLLFLFVCIVLSPPVCFCSGPS